MSYIGLDVGTSGCKASVLRPDGQVVATARRDYSFVVPRPEWAELDPGVIAEAALATLAELAPSARDAEAIAVSSIGEAMVMTDAADRVLYNAITYVDNRCEETVAEIDAVVPGREMHALSGTPPNQMYSLNKLLWLRRNRPEVLDATRKIFLFVDYLGYLLTGERLVDPGSAARTMLLDAKNLAWSEPVARRFGIDPGLFSPLGEPGSRVGVLRPAIAARTGLPAATTVVLGCHDHPCGTLGSGTLAVGDIFLGIGSSESLSLVVSRDGLTDSLLEHAIAFEPFFNGNYFISAGQLTHGTAIRWFIDMFREKLAGTGGPPGESIYARADRLAAADSENLYFLPYMSGVDPNDADNDAKGCFIGLDVTTEAGRMYRAVLEGLCFETRARVERLSRGGLPLGKFTAAGGGAKSPLLMQMKADVLERPLHVLRSEEACIQGLGMICAVSRGAYANYAEAAAHFVHEAGVYQPRTDYRERYRGYQAVNRAVRALYRELRGK